MSPGCGLAGGSSVALRRPLDSIAGLFSDVEAIASGVLAPAWINNPLLRLQRVEWQQSKLAEMLQVGQQWLRPQTAKLSPRLTFASPTSGEALRREAGSNSVSRC
jgi:hypothetical protein